MTMLESISQTGLSVWIREGSSIWAYPMIITFHSAGLAVMVGLSVVVALRILGVARGLPLASLRTVYPVMWLGFWVNAVSGVLLIISDPVSMLTNPLFLLKMGIIGSAVANLVLIDRRVLRPADRAQSNVVSGGARGLAFASLMLWAAATTAGRLTAYLGG